MTRQQMRKLRRTLDLKQQEVAHRARCSAPTVSNIETGRVPVKQEIVARVIKVLEAEQKRQARLEESRAA